MSKCIGLKCKPIPQPKIGFIGMGKRGIATLERYMIFQEVHIAAICDLDNQNIQHARQIIELHGRTLPTEYTGDNAWIELCQQADLDLVYICTDWETHAEMAICAMKHGKHVALEVPAAMTVRECWELVHTAEDTQRHCIMLENCCYDTFHLGIMGMKQEELFGDIMHCEGAYIHDLRIDESQHGSKKSWMHHYTSKHSGNPYPTHGLGPVCKIMDINVTDRLMSLSSYTTPNGINSTLFYTKLGKTILLQFDEVTPRPYSRIQTLCGTKGYAQKYPTPTIQLDGHEIQTGIRATELVESHCQKEFKEIIRNGKRLNVPNLMNYAMDFRLISAIKGGAALDMSVYDAALWSCITELSALSAERGGLVQDIPDFLA